MEDRLYFRQVPAGPMANYVYAIGDKATREALLVDPAWDLQALLRLLEQDQMRLVGALVTHYHPDHVGGSIFGMQIEGLPRLMELAPVHVHVNKAEADGVRLVTGLSESDLVRHEGGDKIQVGGLEVELLHTPGHTPGSQCFLVGDRLVSGDTLFIRGCGRVDLPGADPEQMYYTLTQRLAKLPDHIALYPGHNYAEEQSSTLGQERRTNPYLRIPSLQQWLSMMG
jgi:glyoxylase-like metal-dependent hydrolase (beta-lactamase superfamily II)